MAALVALHRKRASSPASFGPLVSEHLHMRGYALEDAPAVFEAIEETRTSLLRWAPDIGRRRTLFETQCGLTNLVAPPSASNERPRIFAIWSASDHSFLGEAGLYAIDRERRVGEVGYWLRRRARGFGYATEATRTLMEYALTECGLLDLEAHVASGNSASERVVKRLGFEIAGRRTPVPHCDGQAQEVLIYALQMRREHR